MTINNQAQNANTGVFWLVALFLLIVIFDGFGPAYAELVTPSHRVTSFLNVRTEPTTSSDVVGVLTPGVYAVLDERIDRWHRIILGDGATGFVSKAWATLVPDIRLGTWNIKKLGHGATKDYSAVAAVINDHFDVLTVIEVMQKSRGHPGYDAIIQALGPSWAGMITSTPRPNTGAGDAEFYAILYRPTILSPCVGSADLEYFDDNDGGPQGIGYDKFVREPAFGCFEAMSETGAKGWDFVLGAYHATWADADTDRICSEASHLGDVYSAMRVAHPGEQDLFIAGDFNLTPADLDGLVAASDMTTGMGSTLNTKGERTANRYDHVLLHDSVATKELALKAQVIDVRKYAASPKLFYQTVSDHLPVTGRFVRYAEDDD